MTHKKMPVVFVSHSSPAFVTSAEHRKPYAQWANNLPQPEAILVFSAHWETSALTFGNTENHDNLIYDFKNFPKALYEIQYPAPSAIKLTHPVIELLKNKYQINSSNRGLDHGVWAPFLHMWPNATIPILQISIPHTFSNNELFELGTLLSPLRDQGILISTNGTLTHNLAELKNHSDTTNQKNAQEFDQWIEKVLLNQDNNALLNWESIAPHALFNHPTPDHFRPLIIAAGASQNTDAITFPIDGFDFDIFSKRCVQFG